MYDRDVEFSQRYRLKKVEGTDDIFDLIPAPGTVNNEGTLINKAALLKDMTAALFGLTTDAVPDDVFKILAQAALYKTVTPTAQLSTLPEGSIIYLNENGSPVPFYVAKQGYEPDYNTDRVLLVRKEASQAGAWNIIQENTYDGSTIDTWMNETYLQSLDNNVQTAIGTTNIPATSPRNSGVIRLNKSIFPLSGTELGLSSNEMNIEGTVVPTATILKTGATVKHWLRSPYNANSSIAWGTTNNGELANNVTTTTDFYYRPAFTLPTTFIANTDVPATGFYDVSDNLLLKLPGVQIETGSYVGTGTYGSSNPNSLTFGFEPKFFVCLSEKGKPYLDTGPDGTLWVNGFTYGGNYGTLQFAVSGNTLSWYTVNSADTQLNASGTTYYYIAIG